MIGKKYFLLFPLITPGIQDFKRKVSHCSPEENMLCDTKAKTICRILKHTTFKDNHYNSHT